jgi:uncharacterized protein (TIGR02268 family)
MLPASPPSMLMFVLLKGAPFSQPPVDVPCEDMRRIELSQDPTAATREVCVSPGLVTSFLFDTRAEVDIQDEVRFVEVMRGRGGIGLVPPRDMAPGERLRVTVRFGGVATQERVTFVLVAYSGQATRQVEVYRDQRSRESYLDEVAQERTKVRQLISDLHQLRSQLNQANEFRGLVFGRMLGLTGTLSQKFPEKRKGYSESGLTVDSGTSYRSDKSVGVQLWLKNLSEEPWTVAEAALTVNGELLTGLIWVAETIPPNEMRQIMVEIDTQRDKLQGGATLALRGKDSRVITLSELTFPEDVAPMTKAPQDLPR